MIQAASCCRSNETQVRDTRTVRVDFTQGRTKCPNATSTRRVPLSLSVKSSSECGVKRHSRELSKSSPSMRARTTTMKICGPSKWPFAECEASDREASLTGPYFKYRGPSWPETSVAAASRCELAVSAVVVRSMLHFQHASVAAIIICSFSCFFEVVKV